MQRLSRLFHQWIPGDHSRHHQCNGPNTQSHANASSHSSGGMTTNAADAHIRDQGGAVAGAWDMVAAMAAAPARRKRSAFQFLRAAGQCAWISFRAAVKSWPS